MRSQVRALYRPIPASAVSGSAPHCETRTYGTPPRETGHSFNGSPNFATGNHCTYIGPPFAKGARGGRGTAPAACEHRAISASARRQMERRNATQIPNAAGVSDAIRQHADRGAANPLSWRIDGKPAQAGGISIVLC